MPFIALTKWCVVFQGAARIWRGGGVEGWRGGGVEGWRDGGVEGWRDGSMEEGKGEASVGEGREVGEGRWGKGGGGREVGEGEKERINITYKLCTPGQC